VFARTIKNIHDRFTVTTEAVSRLVALAVSVEYAVLDNITAG